MSHSPKSTCCPSPALDEHLFVELVDDGELSVLRDEYRMRVLDALNDAERYDGTEAADLVLFEQLISLEAFIANTWNDGDSLDEITESFLLQLLLPEVSEARTVDGFLDLAIERLSACLAKKEMAQMLNIFTVQSDSPLLPSGDTYPGIIPGAGVGVEGLVVQSRLAEVLELLNRNGIYTDDVVLVSGKNTVGMMRQLPYTLVEIPRLRRQLLVCDEVGEATFVVLGMLNRDVFFSMSKDELLHRFSEMLVRVVRVSEEQWRADVHTALFDDNVIRPKIDVRSRDELGEEIRKRYTDEEWLHMKRADKKSLKVCGLGLTALGTIFGLSYSPLKSNFSHLELGVAIFGDDAVAIREKFVQKRKEKVLQEELGKDVELWREEVKKVCSVDEWLNMNQKQKFSFMVCGFGIRGLATLFGVLGNPRLQTLPYLELGLAIFGNDAGSIRALLMEIGIQKALQEELGTDVEKWRLEVKKVCSLDEWLSMNQKQKFSLKVCGLGLTALGTIFGVSGRPSNNIFEYLELGVAIFGDDAVAIREKLVQKRKEKVLQEELGNDVGLWREEVKKVCSVDEWLNMTRKQMHSFKVCGFGLTALGTIFGVSGKPSNNILSYLELGVAIFGEDAGPILELLKKKRLSLALKRDGSRSS